jgi:hypothetical protein
VSPWTCFSLVALALVATGCNQCTSSTVALTLADGGPVRCVTAEDCPRTGNDLVCVTTSPVDFSSTCVACPNTTCTRTTVSCP